MDHLGHLLHRWIRACSKVNDCLDCQQFQACQLIVLLQNSASFAKYGPEISDLSLN